MAAAEAMAFRGIGLVRVVCTAAVAVAAIQMIVALALTASLYSLTLRFSFRLARLQHGQQ